MALGASAARAFGVRSSLWRVRRLPEVLGPDGALRFGQMDCCAGLFSNGAVGGGGVWTAKLNLMVSKKKKKR